MTRFLGDAVTDDVGPVEGAVFLAPTQFLPLTNATLTRNAAGDISVNVAASNAAVITACLSEGLLRRVLALAGGTALDGTNLVLGDAAIAKGLKITDITVHYQIGTNPLGLHTIRVDRIKMVNNVANALVVVLANAANGLATAAQVNPYTTKIAIVDPQSTAGFDTSDNSGVHVEIAATTPAGGTYRLYGMTVHFTFNYD